MKPSQPSSTAAQLLAQFQQLEQSLESWIAHCKNPVDALQALRSFLNPDFAPPLPSARLLPTMVPTQEATPLQLGGFAASFPAYAYSTDLPALLVAAHALERQFFMGQPLPQDLSLNELRAFLYLAWRHRQQHKHDLPKQGAQNYLLHLLGLIREAVNRQAGL